MVPAHIVSAVVKADTDISSVVDCCPSVVTCPPLNASHGNTTNTSRGYLDDVHLHCRHGYRVVGNQSLSNVTAFCTAAGNWSVADLDCERKSPHHCWFLSK